MTDSDSLESTRQLLAEVEALRDDLRTAAAEAVEELGLGTPAVEVEFGDDGVASRVHIDDEARASLTEGQLFGQLAFAMASGPVPTGVLPFVRQAMTDPALLRPHRASSRDGALNATGLAGRVTELWAAQPGWLLFQPSEDIATRVLALARAVAEKAAAEVR